MPSTPPCCGRAPDAIGPPGDDPPADRRSLRRPEVALSSTSSPSTRAARPCRHVDYGLVSVVGFAADVAATEVLFTSLLVQSHAAMLAEAANAPPGAPRPWPRPSVRRSCSPTPAASTSASPRSTKRSRRRRRPRVRGSDLLPVLAARADAIDEEIAATFGPLTTSTGAPVVRRPRLGPRRPRRRSRPTAPRPASCLRRVRDQYATRARSGIASKCFRLVVASALACCTATRRSRDPAWIGRSAPIGSEDRRRSWHSAKRSRGRRPRCGMTGGSEASPEAAPVTRRRRPRGTRPRRGRGRQRPRLDAPRQVATDEVGRSLSRHRCTRNVVSTQIKLPPTLGRAVVGDDGQEHVRVGLREGGKVVESVEDVTARVGGCGVHEQPIDCLREGLALRDASPRRVRSSCKDRSGDRSAPTRFFPRSSDDTDLPQIGGRRASPSRDPRPGAAGCRHRVARCRATVEGEAEEQLAVDVGDVDRDPSDEDAVVGLDLATEAPLLGAARPGRRHCHRGGERLAEVADDVDVERQRSPGLDRSPAARRTRRSPAGRPRRPPPRRASAGARGRAPTPRSSASRRRTRRSRTRRSAGTSAGAASRCAGAAGRPGSAASPGATPRTTGSCSGGWRGRITSASRPWCSARYSQSRSGHADASTNSLALSGTDWAPNSLTKRTSAGQRAGPLGELVDVAAVPAEPQVAVGAVELREVGEHAAVGDRRARRVGLLERPLHPAIEHRLVPRRQLLAGEPAQAGARRVAVELRGVGDRLVVGAPLDDRRVMAERRHRLARLADRLPADVAPVAPLQREVLEEHHAELVGRRVQVVGGDVRLHSQGVEAGLDGPLDVGADELGGRRRPDPGRAGNEVGALEEQPLAVDREHPVGERHLAEPGAPRRPVADLAVDDDLDATRRSAAGRRASAATTGVARRCRATTRCRCCRRRGCARSRRRRRRRRTCGCGPCRWRGRRGGRAGAGGHGSRRRRGTARAGDRCARRRCRGCAPCATDRRGSSRDRRPRSAAACR